MSNTQKDNTSKRIPKRMIDITFVFYLIFLLLFFTDNCYSQSGWYQVPLPMSGTIWNMQFLNHNLGWIRMNDTANQYAYILRTTNGGNNFTIIGPQNVGKFYFFNDTLGYGLGSSGGNSIFSKTTNSGFNWSTLLISSQPVLCFYFINPDTGWLGIYDGSNFSLIKRTTDACQSFQTIWSSPGQGVDDILFTKPSFGGQYFGWIMESGVVSKTTNSGFNWTETSILYGQAMYFLNKDTGWIADNSGGNIYYTTNSGLNWTNQYIPAQTVFSIPFANPRKGWGGGGFGFVCATSNSGSVWGKQTIPVFTATRLFFIDSLYGWGGSINLIHTTDGGGPIMSILLDSNSIPGNYILKQNYPNPFNSGTVINYSLPVKSNVSLILYDITGKEIIKVINNELFNSGSYKITLNFSRWNVPSGVYFYRLEAIDNKNEKVFLQTKKMIYMK